MDVEEKLKSLVQTIVIVSIAHEKKNWKNIRNTMRNVNLTTFYIPQNSLIHKAFWHIFTKNSIFLNVDIVKYLQKYDTKTIVMEETNRQSLYVCFATLLSGIADSE